MHSGARPTFGVALVISLACVASVGESQARGQVRDQPAASLGRAETTATISGTVVAEDTARPIRGADVALSGSGLRPGSLTTTDADGRFTFSGLPPGSYDVSASRLGYVPLSYGQRRRADSPLRISVSAGASETALIVLPRSGVIVARVVDTAGEPLAGYLVSALSPVFRGGELQWIAGGVANRFPSTDDRGEVRLFGLEPGGYLVSVTPGYVGPLVTPRVLGETYFPGTTSQAEATKVEVTSGTETYVAITFTPARRLTLTGVAVDSSGQAVTSGTLTLAHRSSAGDSSRPLIRSADGRFEASSLAAGDYVVMVETGNQADGKEYAVAPLRLADADLENVVINTRPASTLTGRIEFDGAPPPETPDAIPLVVSLSNRLAFSTGRTAISSNWSFQIGDVVAQGLLRVEGANNPWFVKRVVVQGADVTDAPVDFHARSVTEDILVVLARRTAALRGTVAARGAPAPLATVVVFPADRTLWTNYSQFIATGKSDLNGRYSIGALPAGEFFVIAVPTLMAGSQHDPQVLAQWATHATTIRLANDESRSVDVEVQAP